MTDIPPSRRHAPLPVLMYHSVSSVTDAKLRALAVPPALLREQLTALRDAGYRLVGQSEALDLRAAGDTGPVVAVTFDDGYADFRAAALPVLASLDASATLYVAVGHLGGPAVWLGERAGVFGDLMDWRQLDEVATSGIEIGNHSLVHHPLDVLPPADLEREIRDSRDRLADRYQRPIRSFCYPHGYHNHRVRRLVARYGHDNACEVGRRLCRPADGPLAVPRLQPTPDHSGQDVLRLVRAGEGRLVPTAKRLAQPAWRVTRLTAARVFDRTLT